MSQSNPISFSVIQYVGIAKHTLYECPNYTGYVPKTGDKVKLDGSGYAFTVQSVIWEFDAQKAFAVTLYI